MKITCNSIHGFLQENSSPIKQTRIILVLALDRPTDYLFDYNYLGRSESSGFYSQQIIIAEGGFKSRLESPFANNFMFTNNTSLSVWRWIEAYGDIGLIKNKNETTRFVYDAGIRLNLVTRLF